MISGDGSGEASAKLFAAVLDTAAKPCGCCKTAAALLYCRTDSAFMCIACDAKIHDSRCTHERVWVCEVCEQAPAAVTCKADAAALCVACDRDIHSANPLARRHDRAPVIPFYDSAAALLMKVDAAALLPAGGCGGHGLFDVEHDVKLEQGNGYITEDPWIAMNTMELLFQDSGPKNLLDFENYQTYSDSIVPVQNNAAAARLPVPAQDYPLENRLEIDFTKSNITSYNSYTSGSVSSSSLDYGVVPDGSCTMSEISYSFGSSVKSSVSKVVGTDRKARVLRYREKRKNRRFEKTIRYASRKAYAESRPRIKGRFAKRTDAEDDIDRIFDLGLDVYGAAAADSGYSIVPLLF